MDQPANGNGEMASSSSSLEDSVVTGNSQPQGKFKTFFSNLKMSFSGKKVSPLITTVLMVLALPVLVLTLITSRTFFFNKAASGEPPPAGECQACGGTINIQCASGLYCKATGPVATSIPVTPTPGIFTQSAQQAPAPTNQTVPPYTPPPTSYPYSGICVKNDGTSQCSSSGSTPTPTPSSCPHKEPTITITPTKQSALPGSPLTYKILVHDTIMDINFDGVVNILDSNIYIDKGCPSTDFRIGYGPFTSGWNANLLVGMFTLKPGFDGTTSLIVTSPRVPQPSPGPYTIGATVEGVGGRAATTAVYEVLPGTNTPTPTPFECGMGPQTVTLTPQSQTGKPGQPISYNISVKNNNSANCPTATFYFSARTPDSNWIGLFTNTSLTLPSGATGSAQVAFVSSPKAALNGYPVGVDVKGPSHVVSASATYIVSNSTPTPSPKPTPRPTPIITSRPVISTNVLPVARVGVRYSANIVGYDTNPRATLDMTISNLPAGLVSSPCLTRTGQGATLPAIYCNIQGTPRTWGLTLVRATLRDSFGRVTAKNVYLWVSPF